LNSLARLAVDSGGRFTERTNDLARSVTNARRDLACVYSLGFYDDHPEDERIRNAVVRIRRPGVQALHAAKFVHRSPAARRESLIRAGFLDPESDGEQVLAKLYPLRPLSGSKWDGILAVSFTLSEDAFQSGALERDFGGVLYRGSKVIHRFDRRVTLKRSSTGQGQRVTYLETISVKPGPKTLQVVVSDPATGDDRQARIEIDVPEVPRDRLFVVGPMFGRRAGPDLLLKGGASTDRDTVGGQRSFEPLLANRIDDSTELLAVSQVCYFETGKAPAQLAHDARWIVHRELLGADRLVVGRLPQVDLALEGADRIRCQNLLDLLPASSLDAGKYTLRVSVSDHAGNDISEAEVSFAVAASVPEP